MIRYIWNGEAKYLYKTDDFRKEEKTFVPYDQAPIFVNILDHKTTSGIKAIKVRLFYSDGRVLDGWTMLNNEPISITNKDELFDGRFNV